MKYLILFLVLISFGALADDSALCLNKDFIATGAEMTVKAGKYQRIGGTDSNTIYAVNESSVTGKQSVIQIKVTWTKQYIGKQNICFVTIDNGSFCGLVKTGGENIKPFEKC